MEARGITGVEGHDGQDVSGCKFVAVTVNVTSSPFVKPVTTIGLVAPVTIIPVLEVTVKKVRGTLPVNSGGVKDTRAWALPGWAMTLRGASGEKRGRMAALGAEGLELIPRLFVATTVKVTN
jgi:hypothetical protein